MIFNISPRRRLPPRFGSNHCFRPHWTTSEHLASSLSSCTSLAEYKVEHTRTRGSFFFFRGTIQHVLPLVRIQVWAPPPQARFSQPHHHQRTVGAMTRQRGTKLPFVLSSFCLVACAREDLAPTCCVLHAGGVNASTSSVGSANSSSISSSSVSGECSFRFSSCTGCHHCGVLRTLILFQAPVSLVGFCFRRSPVCVCTCL